MRIKSTNGDVTIAHQKWGWDLLEDICDYLSVPMTFEPEFLQCEAMIEVLHLKNCFKKN